ncbi:MAG: PadR family transcriptional regulator [Longimicrobiales bacterium]
MNVNTPDARDLLPLRPLEFSILLSLAEGDRYGYDIVKRIAKRSGGGVRLSPGNLYQVLDRMIDAGLIDMKRRRDRADERRRYYGITAFGQRVMVAEATRLEDVMRTVRGLEILPETRGR